LWWTAYCLRRLNYQGQPLMFYVHPWELDPGQPRLPARLGARFRHYVNLTRTESKLDELLGRFRFGSLSEVLEQYHGTLDPAAQAGAPLRLQAERGSDAKVNFCLEPELEVPHGIS